MFCRVLGCGMLFSYDLPSPPSHVWVSCRMPVLANPQGSSLIIRGELHTSRLSLSLMLRPSLSRPVFLGVKYPSGAKDQIFITVRQLQVCWCGAPCRTRGRVCNLQLLLVVASTFIHGSESRGARDYILLSQIRDFPFRRLLRLAGLRWRYSNPPPHGIFPDTRCSRRINEFEISVDIHKSIRYYMWRSVRRRFEPTCSRIICR
jgi:hypothetical protein